MTVAHSDRVRALTSELKELKKAVRELQALYEDGRDTRPGGREGLGDRWENQGDPEQIKIMKVGWIICLFLIAGTAVFVYGLSNSAHMFLTSECVLCHMDAKNDPDNIRPSMANACFNCHREVTEVMSHPTNIYPNIPVPADMPLTDGKLTCLTCHYVHPKKEKQPTERHYFLRRLVRESHFCRVCHEINDKDHYDIWNIHPGSYQGTDTNTTIDWFTLECIECHDDRIEQIAGNWEYTNKTSHPIGIKYSEARMKKMDKFRPVDKLRKEVALFDGKIGCGSCHSIYSSNRKMLVLDNLKDGLCRECHLEGAPPSK